MDEGWLDGKLSPTRHGTPSGYRKHQDEGTDPCVFCATAKQQYDARGRETPKVTRKNRLSAMAQQRAKTELTHLFPDEFRLLYEHHKQLVMLQDRKDHPEDYE